MIDRLDSTLRNAAGLVADGRAVPSTTVAGGTGGEWRGIDREHGRMKRAARVAEQDSVPVTQRFRDAQSRHNRGAGPVAGASTR